MSTEHMEELNDQQIVRREKMAALREQGIDPFGKRFERTANSQELKDKFAELDKEQLHELNETATIAGRLVTKRGKGKVGFAHLQDREGQIQIYVRKDGGLANASLTILETHDFETFTLDTWNDTSYQQRT